MPFAFFLTLLCLAFATGSASAQQRSFVNLGFEQPDLGTTPCYEITREQDVPGWNSTESNNGTQGTCAYVGTAGTSGVIELWVSNYNSVLARQGKQFAELNAYNPARLSQNVCLYNGETVGYQFSHRARSATETAVFSVTNQSVGRVTGATSATNGTGLCDLSTTGTSVSDATCSRASGGNGWNDFTGTFVWNGATGVQDIGFEALAGGSAGNFLDNVDVTLRPVLEFSSATFTTSEGGTITAPSIQVLGTVPANTQLIATVTAGTAASGSDYTVSATPFTIPAGTYPTATVIPLTGLINIINDTVIEDNEELTITISPGGTAYTMGNTAACGGSGRASTTYRILDNDVDLRTTKTLNSSANPVPGGTSTFTVVYQNNTARPTVGAGTDLNAHDATAILSDALPAGFSAMSWTCASSGSPAPACPAASGSGAINSTLTLPAGSGVAGGLLTFIVTGTVGTSQCSAVTNTSTVAVSGNFQEGSSAQGSFTTPAPQGATNNSASANVDPGCLTLNKVTSTASGGPFNFTLTGLNTTSASVSTTAPATATQVDGNTSAGGLQPFGITPGGSGVSIEEVSLPTGFSVASAVCRNGSGVVVGNSNVPRNNISSSDVGAGVDINCTFTNGSNAAVAVTKTTRGGFGGPFTFAATNLTSVPPSITTTAADTAAPPSPAYIPVTANGTAVTITETPASGYTISSAQCSNSSGTIATTLSGNQVTIPASAIVFGAQITCNFVNDRLPTITLTKTSVGGSGAFTFTGNNGFAAPSQIITTPGTTGGTASGATVTLTAANTATTINETALPAGFALTGISCSGLGVGGAATPTITGNGASGGSIALNAAAVAPGANIACTFTNTRRTLTLRKAWVGAAVGETVTVNATRVPAPGVISLASTADTASETDVGAATQIFASEVYQLAETFGTPANAANYNTSLFDCTGTSGLNAATGQLTVGAADTDIVCTITNTRKLANLVTTKTTATPMPVPPGASVPSR